MNHQTVLVERIGRVTVITLNRPEVMNCINTQISIELGHALEAFAQDEGQWAAVLTGAGDQSFCAGADLKAAASGEFDEPAESLVKWGFAGLVRHFVAKPVIAAVNGYALGAGTEIALSCDLVVASTQASFGLPEVCHGVLAGAGGLLRLPRQIPLKVAMHCILTGRPLTAEQAACWGLVNEVVPHGETLAAAIELGEEICKNAPLAVRASKNIVYRGLDAPLDFPGDAWDINSEYSLQLMSSEDAKEGLRAFVEKRRPRWRGC